MNDQRDRFAAARQEMVADQLIARGIRDTAVLHAMGTVPRELFVLPEYQEDAYANTPLPIPGKQTISQPFVVAYMLSALQLKPTYKALEIGCGSGYATAVLSQIVTHVVAVERMLTLVDYAQKRIAQLGYDNIMIRHGDGSLGWPAAAPYDAILVSAGGPKVPQTLKMQLAENGLLVMPVGKKGKQRLLLTQRLADNEFRVQQLGRVSFVPLIGAAAWKPKK